MEGAVAPGSVQCRASACTAGGCVSPRFALPRVASRARSRQPAWAASAARRGPSARRNGCKNCRALCCRVLRSGLQSRVKRSARGKKGTRPRVIAQSALYIYMGHSAQGATPSSRHRACGAHNTCMPGRGRYRGARREKLENLRCRALARGKEEPVIASLCIVPKRVRGPSRAPLSKARPVLRGAWRSITPPLDYQTEKCGGLVSMAMNRLCRR